MPHYVAHIHTEPGETIEDYLSDNDVSPAFEEVSDDEPTNDYMALIEAAHELLDICDWPRRYDQEDYDRAVSALRDATPPKPAPPIDYDPEIHPF